jgi:hypothetical protein
MQAVRCQHCNNLVSPGNYDALKIAPAAIHFPDRNEDTGFAVIAECVTRETCAGSNLLGRVEDLGNI